MSDTARFRFPVTLDVTGRRCVVVGGGAIADEKAAALRAAGADVHEVWPNSWRAEDFDGAFLAIVTGEDDTDPDDALAAAEERGVLLNVMDDIPHCHYAFPAIVRRGDLQVAISTAGKAPALARQLRLRLDDELPEELATLVDAIGAAREALLPRTVPFAEWQRRWRTVLADLDGLLALCADGDPVAARDRIVGGVADEVA